MFGGQAWFDELQARKWEKGYAYLFNAKFYWMVFSIAYGMAALKTVILTDFPVLAPMRIALRDVIKSAVKWFWNLFPGPDA